MEVAGLVLGVIPIVIEAIEIYLKVRKHWKDFRHKAEHLRKLIQCLRENDFIVRCDLFKLLKGAGINSVAAAEAKSNCQLAFLADDCCKEQLVEYLGQNGFNLYIARLEECQSIVAAIAGRFQGLLPDSECSNPDNASAVLKSLFDASVKENENVKWRQHPKKLKFCMEKHVLDEKIERLRHATEMLQRLHLSAADDEGAEIESPSGSKRVVKLVRYFARVQNYAEKLHTALICALPSSCHTQHSVRMILDDRANLIKQGRAKGGSETITFRVDIVSYSASKVVDFWHQGHVQLLGQTYEQELLLNSSPLRATVHGNKRLRFDISPEKGKRPIQTSLPEPIYQICPCVKDAKKAGKAIAFHLSDCGRLSWSPTAPTLGSSEAQFRLSQTSLCEILSKSHDRNSRAMRRWTLEHRMQLAFKLACSLLQLNRTRWMSMSCRAEDIFFEQYETDDDDQTQPPFNPCLPFLCQSDTLSLGITPRQESQHLILDLGILLLELWQRQTIEQWAAENEFPYDATKRWAAAKEWLESCQFELPPRYCNAVRSCIRTASVSGETWCEEEVRHRFASTVVRPLWENFKGLTLSP